MTSISKYGGALQLRSLLRKTQSIQRSPKFHANFYRSIR
jgi:hypothetical protein